MSKGESQPTPAFRVPHPARSMTRRLVVPLMLGLLVAMMLPGSEAKALVGTPYQCDDPVAPKYYCSTVQYDTGSPATNVARYYEAKIS